MHPNQFSYTGPPLLKKTNLKTLRLEMLRSPASIHGPAECLRPEEGGASKDADTLPRIKESARWRAPAIGWSVENGPRVVGWEGAAYTRSR